MKLTHRPRRLRQSENIRRIASETKLSLDSLIYPFFAKAEGAKTEISSMPGQFRWSRSEALDHLGALYEKGARSFALFPVIDAKLKNAEGSEALNPDGLAPQIIRDIKQNFSQALVFADVALDPYTSHGHDGLLNSKTGLVANDETLEVLQKQALVLAQAGVDFICPSDMMDGRIAAIRSTLDENSLENTGLVSYCAKYASAFYGPFRDALSSAPASGDKKSYQMNPANRREALRELSLDLDEGADIVMVKPAGAYLDIISDFKQHSDVPVAAYQVSGEYSMITAAAQKGWLNEEAALLESLMAIRRAGADMIFSYFVPKIIEKNLL